ncbi:hypothetical protein [Mycobacterium simulans]|uniref:hypothetical protein n=1 Tax=Mycobacterium simulans TaxID=627089 RepID=UPI00163F6C5F|nr:hypothetical protein [Mycobacterium simulans]
MSAVVPDDHAVWDGYVAMVVGNVMIPEAVQAGRLKKATEFHDAASWLKTSRRTLRLILSNR